MDTKHLRYLLMIAKEGNITKAADKLFISQSSLSYTLSSIEKDLGQPLFYRQRNGVSLTPAGSRYIRAAEEILRIHDDLMQELHYMQNNTNIRVASSSVWGTKLIEETIPKFRKKHPEAFFDVTAGVEMHFLDTEIHKGNIDFAFISLSPFDKDYANSQLLREEPIYFAVPASHSYTKENPGDIMSLEDIPKYFSENTFLLSRPGSSIRVTVDHLFQNLNFTPRRLIEMNGLHITRGMVAEGEGPAFIPISACYQDERIHYYRFDPILYRYNLLVSKPLMNCNETEQAFYRYILSYYKKQP